MGNRVSLSMVGLMIAGLWAAPAARAGTDELCVEQAYGVPGPQPKHPEWWDTALTEAQRETRWTGSSAIYDTGSAAPPIGSGRMIWDKPSQRMFFEFEVNGDPSLDANQDLVMLTVSDVTGTDPDLYIQFQPLQGCSPVSNCTGLGSSVASTSVEYSQATVGTSVAWSTLSNTNPSTAWTVHDPWVEVKLQGLSGPPSYRWTLKFALEIPVDAGSGEAWPDLRVYGNSVMYMPGTTSGTAVEYPLMCEPSSPTSNDCLVFSSGTNPLPQGLPVNSVNTTWSHVTTGSLAQCDGVEVIRSLVGSDYNTTPGNIPGTSISYILPGHQIPKISGAHLQAGFFNDTSSALAAGDIDVDFSVANWGLQWSSWQNASWNLIDSASLSGTVTAGGYAGAPGQGQLQTGSPWVPSSSGLSLTNDHQCMHVRLTANAGGINFKRDSVYRNMDLVNASVFRRPIDLDMSERPIPEGQEDNEVYLLVHTENMPSVQDCLEKGQTLRGCAEGGPLVLGPGKGDGKDQELQMDVEQMEADAPAEPLGMKSDAQWSEAANGGGKKYATLEELPKLVVYAFARTGGFINLPDAPETPVLKPFSEFGYYVQHEGEPSQGWQHYMTAPGAVPVEPSPGLYRIHAGQDEVLALSNTIRVVDGVQQECVLPELDAVMPADEALAKMESMMAKGLEGVLREQVVGKADFGCNPPPLREPCGLGGCAPHNPISYIEGSAYVGEWTEPLVAKMYPDDTIPDHLALPSDDEADSAVTDGELVDLPGGVDDGCCVQASVDPHAGGRGAAKLSAMAMLLLLLRRGRRRRRRR